MQKKPSCTFAGPKEKELPFSIDSEKYEEIEYMLKDEILRLINLGVTTFYVSGETGIETTCAQIVIYLRDKIKYDIKLMLVVASEDIKKDFNQKQLDDYEWIKARANFLAVLYKRLNRKSIRRRNKFVMKNSGYLIAMWDGKKKGNVWNVIKLAKRRRYGVEKLESFEL